MTFFLQWFKVAQIMHVMEFLISLIKHIQRVKMLWLRICFFGIKYVKNLRMFYKQTAEIV
jgi:hypothetical protein